MKKIGLFISCMFLVACASVTPSQPQQKTPPKALNDVEKVYISQIETEGRLMYEKDIRAALATDLLLSKINPSDYPGFVGWVTYPNREDFTVSFYEEIETDFKVIADVKFRKGGKHNIQLSPNRVISETEQSMLKARIAALESGVNSCSDRFNTVVIPSQNKDGWDVYVLAATTNPKLMQVGGHIKVMVSKTTSKVIKKLPLSKSCIALDKSGGNLPEGASLAALAVTHVVTPMPVAIHPYLNLLHDINLSVSTQRGLWMIESGRVRALR